MKKLLIILLVLFASMFVFGEDEPVPVPAVISEDVNESPDVIAYEQNKTSVNMSGLYQVCEEELKNTKRRSYFFLIVILLLGNFIGFIIGFKRARKVDHDKWWKELW